MAYLVYLYMVYAYGRQEKRQGRGAPRREKLGLLEGLARSRTVEGKVATYAVLLGFSTAWLTFSKTVLYWLNEAFSGMLTTDGFMVAADKGLQASTISAITT